MRHFPFHRNNSRHLDRIRLASHSQQHEDVQRWLNTIILKLTAQRAEEIQFEQDRLAIQGLTAWEIWLRAEREVKELVRLAARSLRRGSRQLDIQNN